MEKKINILMEIDGYLDCENRALGNNNGIDGIELVRKVLDHDENENDI